MHSDSLGVYSILLCAWGYILLIQVSKSSSAVPQSSEVAVPGEGREGQEAAAREGRDGQGGGRLRGEDEAAETEEQGKSLQGGE